MNSVAAQVEAEYYNTFSVASITRVAGDDTLLNRWLEDNGLLHRRALQSMSSVITGAFGHEPTILNLIS